MRAVPSPRPDAPPVTINPLPAMSMGLFLESEGLKKLKNEMV
jgi:hypothetical protein